SKPMTDRPRPPAAAVRRFLATHETLATWSWRSAPSRGPRADGRPTVAASDGGASGGSSETPPTFLPPEERAFCREAGTEGDHDAPVAQLRVAGAQDLVEHEQHRRGRHVAEAAQHLAGEDQVAVREAEGDLRTLDDPTPGRVEDPEAHVLAPEPVILEEAHRHLLHHGGGDAADLL